MSERVQRVLVRPQATITEGMAVIGRGRMGIALAVDENGRLLGTVTDGDVRRAILNGMQLSTPLSEIMNVRFKAAPAGTSRSEQHRILTVMGVRHLPLVDAQGRVQDIVVESDWLEEVPDLPCLAVIMAGGEGRRLRPLTAEVPKPMLPLGEQPLLAFLVERLASQGIRRIQISINYLGHVIKEYFGDGSAFRVEIEYLEEPNPLGTAGALAQLAGQVDEPILVINGDLITTMDFTRMIDHHLARGHLLTVGTRVFSVEIPFGVLEVSDQEVRAIHEKPSHDYLVSCGIYVMSPQILNLISGEERLDMPDLIQRALTTGSVGAYPVLEYWSDIGRPDEYYRALAEWSKRER